MSKEVVAVIKLQVPAGGAKAGPPIGPALAQKKVNIMDFCRQFNDLTKDQEAGVPLPTVIDVFADKSFKIHVGTPPVSYMLKKAAGIEKGCSKTGREGPVGSVTQAQVESVAKAKMSSLNCYDIEAASKMVAGSARSMGLKIRKSE